MDKKIDRRVIKTKKAIRKSFAEILKYKKFDDITVKDIAVAADISRKTFYFYYKGIWQIKEEIENEITELFEQRLDENVVSDYFQHPYNLFNDLNLMLDDYRDFFSALLSNQDNIFLIRKLAITFGKKLKIAFIKKYSRDDQTIDVAVRYCVLVIFVAYHDWFTSKPSRPIKEVCEVLAEIMFNGLNSLL